MADLYGTQKQAAWVGRTILGGAVALCAIVLLPYWLVLQGTLAETERTAAAVRAEQRTAEETAVAIRAEQGTAERIERLREELARLDGRALHMKPAEADHHCQTLLYKWAGAGNLEGALARGLERSDLSGPRYQCSYRLAGTATLGGVRDMLYAMWTDPADRDVRRLRRLDLVPVSHQEPERLRIELRADWLLSSSKGIAPATRPAPTTMPALEVYEPLVTRAVFIPYSPPARVVQTVPEPQAGPRPPRPERRQEEWQLSLVADAGSGPEAEFLNAENLQIKRIQTGASFAGFRVHSIDLAAKAVIFRQGDLLFEVALGKYFSQRRLVGKYRSQRSEGDDRGR